MDWILLGFAGVLATAVMDVFAALQTKLYNRKGLDYALVGRWIGHMPRGRFVHNPILTSEPVAGEAVLGWAAHYVIGVALALILGLLVGPGPALTPSFLLQIGFGIASVLLPFLIMQPGLGFGLFARKTPDPWRARKGSLIAHSSFGVGLYLACWLVALLR